MSDVWLQSSRGRVLDLLDPTREQVDFREIATVLSRLNRYNGHTEECVVSVGLHTIIATSLAPDDLKPFVLIHDAHEYVIGDITTPAAAALAGIAGRTGDVAAFKIVKKAIKDLKSLHDHAIHGAAGLPMPSPEQRDAILKADLGALAVERRDFLMPSPKAWSNNLDDIVPHSSDWSVHKTTDAKAIARHLNWLFMRYLPALRGEQLGAA